MTKQEIIKKFNKENPTLILEIKCKACDSTNITGISVGIPEDECEEDEYEDTFFNLKTGKTENFEGDVIEFSRDSDNGYYYLCVKEMLEKGEELVVLCRDHEDYVDVLEFVFSNGVKIDSLTDDFNEIMLYLLDNGLIEFTE